MPKLIDYPRTTYAGAWELAEITDDTGGKCAIETAARKLNRKVSGSFKAIIGSAVKFGLVTSKRDLLTTTTLFKRIKHAYDKQEELLFHREAFLTPPLFTQLCRKFRSRELPVQMLDVMLIREFGVEEINAQGVAKAFVEGCRMVGLLDERNIVADIDALAKHTGPRREIANPIPAANVFRTNPEFPLEAAFLEEPHQLGGIAPLQLERLAEKDTEVTTTNKIHTDPERIQTPPATTDGPGAIDGPDAIASLFGLLHTEPRFSPQTHQPAQQDQLNVVPSAEAINSRHTNQKPEPARNQSTLTGPHASTTYQIQVSGPGVNTTLSITDEEDITIAMALLQKIKRQLNS